MSRLTLPLLSLAAAGMAAFTSPSSVVAQERKPTKAQLERFDANGDGELDADERKAQRAARAKAVKARERTKGGDDTGRETSGRPIEASSKKQTTRVADVDQEPGDLSRDELMERYDEDGNGVINGPEQKAVAEYYAEKRRMKAERRAARGRGPAARDADASTTSRRRDTDVNARSERARGSGPLTPLADARRKLIAMFDINGNERLDADERDLVQAVLDQEASRSASAPLRRNTSRERSADVEAEPKGETRAERRARLLAEHDTNGDGNLSDDEKAAMHKANAARRAAAKTDDGR